MLSVHGDFQLTQDSLALWLTDLDVLLTNLEHLSEASSNEKIQQLDVQFSLAKISIFVLLLGYGSRNSRKTNEN
jgi:hypothetical protein